MDTIPVIDSADARRLVAEVGVDAAGRAHVRAVGNTPDITRRIETAMAASARLDKARFYAPTGVVVRGWEGYWGTAFALRLALPSVGLLVDWARMAGPQAAEAVGDFLPAAQPTDEAAEEPVEWLTEEDDNTATV